MKLTIVTPIVLSVWLVCSVQAQTQYFEIEQSEIIATHFNDIDFSDVDGDGDLDFVMGGFEVDGPYRTQLYVNDGHAVFTRALNTNFPEVFYPSVVFSDIDGDNDDDLFISGVDMSDVEHGKLYKNDGNGGFSEYVPSNVSLNGKAAFSDIDKDGDQDLCIIGGDFLSADRATLYLNDGKGNFAEDTVNDLQAVAKGTVNFADIDNDGDDDLLITGFSESFTASTKLYTNDGTGKFDTLNSSELKQVGLSAVAFSDVDGDGDLDFVLSGRTKATPIPAPITVLYKNNGTGVFAEATNSHLHQLVFTSASFGDVDNDGDQDLLVSGGSTWTTEKMTSLYLNDGTGVFSETLKGTFDPIQQGTSVFAELTGDDKLDILYSGRTGQLTRVVKVYKGEIISGVEPITSSPMIKAYSFTNSGALNIELDREYADLDVKVYNLLGQTIISQHFANKDFLQLQLATLQGMKLVSIKTNDQEIGIIKLAK